ncbi:MAG: PEGA domain-containing protein [Kofleriaceae bacterium]
MKSRVLFAVCIAVTMLATTSAFAQSADSLKKAQAAFDTAQTEYVAGKFDEAAAGFQEAYAARAFPQFLYNVGASYHMKGKKASDVAAYKKAVEFYKRYLAEEPNATDKAKVEKAIGVLEDEIKRLEGAGTGSGSAATQTPSKEVENLGDVKVRGLVVIVTEPQNATIYLDDKKKGPFATTPWSGSIEGEHKLIIEKPGYKIVESTISADPTKLVQFVSAMAQESSFAWVTIASNVPKSDVYIDDKAIGSVGTTPWTQQLKPGKHTFWISKEGYDEFTTSVDIVPGDSKQIMGTIKGTPIGKIAVTGFGIEDSQIFIDGKVLCERGPCLRSVPQGDHVVLVTREGFKSYERRITIEARAETQVKVTLAPKPSRSDAVVAYVVGALFGGAGIYLGLQASSIHDDLDKEIKAAAPPPASNDSRFTKGKIYAISADAAFAISVITLGTAVYYTLRDKGPPSTALIDAKSVTLVPEINSNYAGLGMEVHW